MPSWWKRLIPEPSPPPPKLVWSHYDEVAQRVAEITASNNELLPELITADTEFCDLDDSVGNMEIIMECEEEFDIEIPDEAANTLLTVGQLTQYIAERLNLARQSQTPAPENHS